MVKPAIDDFHAFLLEMGLRPGVIAPDGKWYSCPTEDRPRRKKGRYLLMPNARCGFGINNRTMTNLARWRPGIDVVLPAFDPAKLEAARREHRQQMIEATKAARAYWETCQPLRYSHPYLESHGLDMHGAGGLRTDEKGWLVVPMYKGGHIMSLQRISPEGRKLYWKGAPSGGCTYHVQRVGSVVTVICEGLATGLAIYACLPTCDVIVTFSSGNMNAATHVLHTPRLIVVAADNDKATAERIGKNPGVEAATRLAEKIGAGVAIPDCQGTDWCDRRSELLAERLAKKLPHERESSIRKAVDAKVAMEISRHSKYVTLASK